MDQKLLAWGLRRKTGPGRTRWPRLWLFTDDRRLPDPRPSVAALPHGRAGVVFRHDNAPGRLALGRDIARLCRQRRLPLVVAGDPRLAAALKAGIHLRAGYRASQVRTHGPVTSSAHSAIQLLRAERAGAGLVFLSPAFATASHAGEPSLGPLRWAAIARRARGCVVAALGGIDGHTVARLPPRLCRAAGAIGALSSVGGKVRWP